MREHQFKMLARAETSGHGSAEISGHGSAEISGHGSAEISGHGSAVSLQLIRVGTRHCRVLY